MCILCFKLARFIFLASATREAKCQQRNFTYNCMKIILRPVWEKKKKINWIKPPLRNFLGLWPPHPSGISNPFRGGWEWIFSGTTQCIQVLSLYIFFWQSVFDSRLFPLSILIPIMQIITAQGHQSACCAKRRETNNLWLQIDESH